MEDYEHLLLAADMLGKRAVVEKLLEKIERQLDNKIYDDSLLGQLNFMEDQLRTSIDALQEYLKQKGIIDESKN